MRPDFVGMICWYHRFGNNKMSRHRALTDAQCRTTKPTEKVQKLSGGRELFLQVTPGGSKLWRMNCHLQAKKRTAPFGSYPDVSLATARLKATKLKDKLAAGIDPGAKEVTTAGATPVKPFKDAAREWFSPMGQQLCRAHLGTA